MRLYNGEPSSDAAAFVECVWHIAPSLFEAPAAAPLPESSAQAFLAALERACEPPVGDASSGNAARSVTRDVCALLHAGRAAMLCALCDLERRTAGATSASAAGGEQPRPVKQKGGPGQRERAFVRGCKSAARKLLFLQSWANELRPDDLLSLCDAAEDYAREVVRLQGAGVKGLLL